MEFRDCFDRVAAACSLSLYLVVTCLSAAKNNVWFVGGETATKIVGVKNASLGITYLGPKASWLVRCMQT
jgi:hypothetical protein